MQPMYSIWCLCPVLTLFYVCSQHPSHLSHHAIVHGLPPDDCTLPSFFLSARIGEGRDGEEICMRQLLIGTHPVLLHHNPIKGMYLYAICLFVYHIFIPSLYPKELCMTYRCKKWESLCLKSNNLRDKRRKHTYILFPKVPQNTNLHSYNSLKLF